MEPRRTTVQRAHRVLLAVLAALLLVLIGTGIWLSFNYQPSGSFAGARPQSGLRVAHRVASTLFIFTALAWFGMSIAVSFERALKRGLPAWVVGLTGMLGALAAALTGHLLPWNELALAPVRRGEFRGFGFVFADPAVHFVLVGTAEVTRASLRTSFVVHSVIIPLVLISLGVIGLRLTRRSRVVPTSD